MIKNRTRLYGGYKTREKQREQHYNWQHQNPDKRKNYNEAYYNKNQDRLKRTEAIRNYMALGKRRKQKEQLKIKVLTYYGNGKLACIICGEGRLACLSIHHIDNNGAEHRKDIKGKDICAWLVQNNYPLGYQTLCMNDQWIKRAEYGKTHRKKQSKYPEKVKE